MQVLQKVSVCFYFLICMLALAFVVFYYTGERYEVHSIILLIISLVFLPVYNYIIDECIRSYKTRGDLHKNQWYLFYALVLLFLIACVFDMFKFTYFAIWAGVLIYVITREVRLFFFGALLLFLFVGTLLLFGEGDSAETYSIYAYYFLVGGVVFQIGDSLIFGEKKSNEAI